MLSSDAGSVALTVASCGFSLDIVGAGAGARVVVLEMAAGAEATDTLLWSTVSVSPDGPADSSEELSASGSSVLMTIKMGDFRH